MPKICLTIKLRRSQLCDKTLYTYVYGICGRTLYGNAGIMLSILEIKIFINKLLIIIEIISSFLHRCQWKNKVLQRIFTSLSSTCTGKNKENEICFHAFKKINTNNKSYFFGMLKFILICNKSTLLLLKAGKNCRSRKVHK